MKYRHSNLHVFFFIENENVHNSNLFEGDMFLTREQRYKAEHGMNVDVEHVDRRKRGSSTRSRHRWQGGVLVYSINTNLGEFLATEIIFCMESILN